MAMMAEAPTSRAAWITLRPTPPAPTTATVSPICTLARLNTAPAPVTTPQPMGAAASQLTENGPGGAGNEREHATVAELLSVDRRTTGRIGQTPITRQVTLQRIAHDILETKPP